MTHSSYGAVVHGHRPSAASTVEARTLDGVRVVVLIAVQGDLATPSLESVKGELAGYSSSAFAVAAARIG